MKLELKIALDLFKLLIYPACCIICIWYFKNNFFNKKLECAYKLNFDEFTNIWSP